MAYEEAYTGGVQVAVGLNSGAPYGGFYRILTGTLTGGPEVTIWQAMENHDTTMDTPEVMFEKVADFFAFDSTQTTGVRVGSVAVSTGSDFLAATGSGISTVVGAIRFCQELASLPWKKSSFLLLMALMAVPILVVLTNLTVRASG